MTDIKTQSLSEELLEHVRALPKGESIDKCIQCGTCSGSCPTSSAMEDYRAAASIVHELAETIPDAELRRGFETSPLVTPILAEGEKGTG